MKDDADFYLCAFHANVDRSDDASNRQRYTQDLSFPIFYTYFLTYYTQLLTSPLYFITIRYYSLEGYVKEAALFSLFLPYNIHRCNT